MIFNFKTHCLFPFAILLLAAAWLLLYDPAYSKTSATPPQVLVIDAGHGGEDGGAVASNGTLESDINLAVALRLEALADFWGVNCIMTRQGPELDYPPEAETLSQMKKADQNARLALINSTPGAVLFSIHQNYYPSESPWGIQVFFGTVSDSAGLAQLTQSNMTAQLCPDNRRLASAMDESIYLINNAKCPAILIECGFISNPDERQKLETDHYQLELASVMLGSYLQYIRGIST